MRKSMKGAVKSGLFCAQMQILSKILDVCSICAHVVTRSSLDWNWAAVFPSWTYLRRQGLRAQSRKWEDAFSPKWRSEGTHQTQWARSGGRAEGDPARRKPRDGSDHPRLRWGSVRVSLSSPRNWRQSAIRKAHHVTRARFGISHPIDFALMLKLNIMIIT